MEEDFAVIVFVQISPDIFVPYEWPVCKVHRILLDMAKHIIMQTDHEDPVFQVNGIPARIHRRVYQHKFFHVFKKIRNADMCGSYVYDITFSEDRNNKKIKYSSETSYKGSSPSDKCSCSGNYTVSCYQVPSRIHKRKALNISDNASKVKRMYQRIVDERVSHDKQCEGKSHTNGPYDVDKAES